jgi:hypothetical protein
LWTDTKLVFRMEAACKGDVPSAQTPTASCEQFLAANERARQQWKLEADFAKFEKKF